MEKAMNNSGKKFIRRIKKKKTFKIIKQTNVIYQLQSYCGYDNTGEICDFFLCPICLCAKSIIFLSHFVFHNCSSNLQRKYEKS